MPKKIDHGPPTRQSTRLSQQKDNSEQTPGETSPKTEELDEDVLVTPSSPAPEEPAQALSNPEPEKPVAPHRDSEQKRPVASSEVKESNYDSATENFEVYSKPKAQVSAGTHNDNDRCSREITPANSAFGSTDFKPTGFAALPEFTPFGQDQDARNPHYDKKARESRREPGMFAGEKDLFDKWIIKLADKCEKDEKTFKKERSHMALIFNMTGGPANDLLESRYQSVLMPFQNTAKMVATLSAVYHDANQASKARAELAKLKYNPFDKEMDIHQFIGKVNSLADKAGIDKDLRKTTFYEHIPADLDTRLLKDSKDSRISYEDFTASVADAAIARHRAQEERKERKLTRHEPSPPETKPRRRPRGYRERRKIKKEVETTTAPVKETPSLSEKEKSALIDAGLCFLCKKPDYQSRHCPDRKIIANMLQAFDHEESDAQSSSIAENTPSDSSSDSEN
ncbi:Uu.00g065890.m01.CDS01 [Anthostomella pinea]|uniref:Uu.00g065890.m01.CDS01 n=1 Tax=Anthostomella pinea TaxID=933095 RepID=A0AAI8VUM3_9PEZI|nr:Uu.00g065890.m01.CDS01 [Anthostomella pinea]